MRAPRSGARPPCARRTRSPVRAPAPRRVRSVARRRRDARCRSPPGPRRRPRHAPRFRRSRHAVRSRAAPATPAASWRGTGSRFVPRNGAHWTRSVRADTFAPHRRLPPTTPPMNRELITTAFELPNQRVARTLGVVRGITVRSRSVFGTIGATFQTLRGGNVTLLTELCEQSREEAFEIAVRYDATEIMAGVTEVLCYGTAVIVEPA